MYQTKEALRLQRLAGMLTEGFLQEDEISDDAIEQEIAKALKIEPEKVDLDRIESGAPNTGEVDEAIGTIITIAGLVPFMLELLGGATNWFAKNVGLDPKKQGTEIGNKLKTAGHKLHHAYVYPIERFLAGIAYFQGQNSKLVKLKDPKFRQKVANIMYAATMASIAGAGVLEQMKELTGVGPVIHAIADAVKTGKSASEIVSGLLSAA